MSLHLQLAKYQWVMINGGSVSLSPSVPYKCCEVHVIFNKIIQQVFTP